MFLIYVYLTSYKMSSSSNPQTSSPVSLYTDVYYSSNGRNGLRNLGNTCFLNSMIQSISHIYPLTSYFMERTEFESDLRRNVSKKEIQLAVQWYHLLGQLWNKRGTIEPVNFKKTFGILDPRIAGFDQQDVHEVLLSFLNMLHDSVSYKVEMNISGNPRNPIDILMKRSYEHWMQSWKNQYSKIIETFGGQYYCTLQCPSCNHISDKFEAFFALTLPITRDTNTIYDCVRKFQEPEILDDENRWNCDNCKQAVNANKRCELWKLPPFLIITLKRFNHRMQKLDKIISFEEELLLSSFIRSADSRRSTYQLQSVIHHMGAYHFGHYVASVRKPDGEWYNYNDSTVTKIRNFAAIPQHTAYTLIYQQVQ
jgi:ubiquitin C-terminal hydrolase